MATRMSQFADLRIGTFLSLFYQIGHYVSITTRGSFPHNLVLRFLACSPDQFHESKVRHVQVAWFPEQLKSNAFLTGL